MTLAAGTRLGAYEIVALIGAGGMVSALDTKLNRPVAIKFLSDNLADAAARRRFEREAQTASSLNHFLADTGFSVSPDGKWVVVMGPNEDSGTAVIVYPVGGGSPTMICEACAEQSSFERGPGPYNVNWSSDRTLMFLNFQGSVYAIPLKPDQALPPIPASGFRTKQDVAALRGARLIAEGAFPGHDPSLYAFTKFSIQRNIYRISVR